MYLYKPPHARGTYSVHTISREFTIKFGWDDLWPLITSRRLQKSLVAILKASDHSRAFPVNQVNVTRLGKGFLRMFISIIIIRLGGKIKTHFIFGASIGSHRSVMLVPVSAALVKSPTDSNVVSQIKKHKHLNLNLNLNLNLLLLYLLSFYNNKSCIIISLINIILRIDTYYTWYSILKSDIISPKKKLLLYLIQRGMKKLEIVITFRQHTTDT